MVSEDAEAEETEELSVEFEADKARVKARVKVVRNIQDTKVPDIRTSIRSPVVDAIGFLEKGLIFVKSQGNAPGGISTLQNRTNEIQTRSAKLQISVNFTTYYTMT